MASADGARLVGKVSADFAMFTTSILLTDNSGRLKVPLIKKLFKNNKPQNVYVGSYKGSSFDFAVAEFDSEDTRQAALKAGSIGMKEQKLQDLPLKNMANRRIYFYLKERIEAPMTSNDFAIWLEYLRQMVKARGGGANFEDLFIDNPDVKQAIATRFESLDTLLNAGLKQKMFVAAGKGKNRLIQAIKYQPKPLDVGSKPQVKPPKEVVKGNVPDKAGIAKGLRHVHETSCACSKIKV